MDPWDFAHLGNVGLTLGESASRVPDLPAVATPDKPKPAAAALIRKLYRRRSSQSHDSSKPPANFKTISFAQLESLSNVYATTLQQGGIKKGDRIALMVPPGIDFVALVFALFKIGAVQILIDPGMGRENLVKCLSAAKPMGIVGTRLAHSARLAYRKWFPDAKNNFVVGGAFPGCKKLTSSGNANYQPVDVQQQDEAAVIFTTGSTGPPKGVLYRHRTFLQQAQQVRDWFHIRPGSADVSGFPLFALFNAAMGTLTVFPEMDPTRPADIWPPNFIHAVETFAADQSFGSPALWNTVSTWCEENNVHMPTIKRVLTAGAPVPPHVLARTKSVIAPDGDVHTPYGATESLPVACISATDVLNETCHVTNAGGGTCVGHKFPNIQWQLIPITDKPVESIQQVTAVPQGTMGELIVKGPVVTDRYVTQTDANALHKIADGDSFWHRMGDVGYFDDQGRFWFCGRKSHRLQTGQGVMFTVPCEAIVNGHDKVYRSALVPAGKPGSQIPVVLAELWPQHRKSDAQTKAQICRELRELAARHWQTDQIEHFHIVDALPVDIRHNSKIFRERLRPLANSIVRDSG